ncbi:hypothetical protein NS359_07985 [Curtobacterium oceanosedimentum]|uniref:Uncharacterized protein n=1 Tax=Curtobacterium oceanosedimentum TaxID=465820 RepID=A0A147DRH3_9MICO|nr:hypothetical protein NS359_07985 [Curtobacterium oceanosedimentum]
MWRTGGIKWAYEPIPEDHRWKQAGRRSASLTSRHSPCRWERACGSSGASAGGAAVGPTGGSSHTGADQPTCSQGDRHRGSRRFGASGRTGDGDRRSVGASGCRPASPLGSSAGSAGTMAGA